MPARLTVAGDACDRSSTSNSSDTWAGMAMRSPAGWGSGGAAMR